MRNVSYKAVEEIKHILRSITFYENRAIYKMWKIL